MKDENGFDPDIGAMDLSEIEKNGLQIYRNYTRAFENAAEKRFAEAVDAEPIDTTNLDRITRLLAVEDARFLPVIACAYADDILGEMYKRDMPGDALGSRKDLLGRFGPFSDLAKKLQLASIFGVISSDMASEVDKLRTVRNKLSHTWDVGDLGDYFLSGPASSIYAIEARFADRPDVFPDLDGRLSPLDNFRIRLIWLIMRLTYEALYYNRARGVQLKPAKALYGPNHPKRLGMISRFAMAATQQIIDRAMLPSHPSPL